GPYTPAKVIGQTALWYSSPFPNANWIVYNHTCTANPAEHHCYGDTINEFYRMTLNLPANICGLSVSTPSVYCLDMDFFADNCVSSIYVNGLKSYSFSACGNPFGYNGYLSNFKTAVSLCNNWHAGTNTLIVHIKSGAPDLGGVSGFLAQVNYSLNPGIGKGLYATSNIMNPACLGGLGAATVTPSGG